MPPLKQVPRLFFLSENQVLLNLQHGLKSIIIKIMGQMEECEEVWLEELKKTKLALHVIHETMSQFIFQVQADFIIYLCKTISDIMCKCTRNFLDPTLNLERLKLVYHLLMLCVLFPTLERIDFRPDFMSENAQDMLILNFQCLSNLSVLNINSNIDPQIICRNIKYLTKLEIFEYPKYSTNNIIKEISRNCPKLKKLNVGYSDRVNDSGAIHLLTMKNLKNLNVLKTQVTRWFYAILVYVGLTNIRNVLWMKGCVDRILTTKLERIEFFHGNVDYLRNLSECCPNLSLLSIVDNVRDDLTCVSFLNLNALSLSCVDSQKIKLNEFFCQIGHQLKKLQLLFVENLNMSSIIKYCINLEFLSLGGCTISDIANNIDIESPHFTSVKELILFSNTEGEKWFDVILPYYKNLQVFLSSNMDELDDEFFENALKRGSFSHVQTFIINYSSKRGVFLLLKYCPELKKLGLLEGTQKIETDFISEIKTLIKQRNYDLELLKLEYCNVIIALPLKLP